MHHITIGTKGAPAVLFTHGWARSHHDFIPVAEALAPYAQSYLVDLPGFGESPRPEGCWDTAAYAAAALEFMRGQGVERFIWVGHSFGGRMGLRAAVQAPEAIAGLVLVAAAGIPRARKPWGKIRGRLRQQIFKFKRNRAKSQAERDALERQFGSADYVHSAQIGMRDIFMATIREDQTAELCKIKAPTECIYGARDIDTPAELGQRVAAGIAGAIYTEMAGYDHFSVLSRGKHQIALAVKSMLEGAQ